MASNVLNRSKALVPRKAPTQARRGGSPEEIGAGEFKAKCLAIIDEVSRSGKEVVITKRGRPTAKLIPFPYAEKSEPFIGRLEGIIEIVGDPDDLINPVFPAEDWDMLK